MRTTLDLPDELMRQLKARAALEGRSLRDVVLGLVERGLQAAPPSELPGSSAPAGLPTVGTGQALPLDAALLNNADLIALANE